MAKSISNVQQTSLSSETGFNEAHSGDFTSDIEIHPTEIIDLSGIKTTMIPQTNVRTSRTAALEAPGKGVQEGKFTVKHVIAGATRALNLVQEDATSTMIEMFAGARDSSASDTVDTDSTTTLIVLTTGNSFAINDIVLIDKQPRIIDSVSGTASFVVKPPLALAPSATTPIYNMEWFKTPATGALTSLAAGISGEDAELSYLLRGGLCASLSLEAFQSNSTIMLSADLDFASHTRGATITHATAQTLTKGITASLGDGVALEDVSGDLWAPCSSEISVEGFANNSFVVDVGGHQGKCGVISLLPEEQSVTMTVFQDASISKLEAIGNAAGSTPIMCTVGDTLEGICGFCVPSASIIEYPTSTPVDNINAITVKFQASEIILFRG